MRYLLHFFWTLLLIVAVFGGQSALAAEGDTQSVTLRWGKVGGSIKYHLQIASDSKFQDVVVDVQSRTPYYQWEEAISGRYFWRVQGFDRRERPGRWSKPGRLVVEAEVADVIVAKPPKKKKVKKETTSTSPQLEVVTDKNTRLAVVLDVHTVFLDPTGPGFPLGLSLAPLDFIKAVRPSFRLAYSNSYSNYIYRNLYGGTSVQKSRIDILSIEALLLWEKKIDLFRFWAGAGAFVGIARYNLRIGSNTEVVPGLMLSTSLAYSLDIFDVVFEASSYAKTLEPQLLVLPSKDLRWSLGLEIPL